MRVPGRRSWGLPRCGVHISPCVFDSYNQLHLNSAVSLSRVSCIIRPDRDFNYAGTPMSFSIKLNPAMGPETTKMCDHRGSKSHPGKSRERGGALVEYAFAVVMSLVLLFGIVDFGRALYSYHFISNAAREGTRYASVRGYTCSVSATPCPATTADIKTFVADTVPQGIVSGSVTVKPTWSNPNSLPICNSGATQNYPGCAVRVEVDYNFNLLFPYNFPPFFQFPASTITMSSTSQMIISR